VGIAGVRGDVVRERRSRMKRLFCGFSALALVLVAGAALAQEKPAAGSADAKGVKEKFYNFDDLLIDGEYKKPNALLFTARDKVKFERLLKLRKSFIPVILTSDKERALR
jgi:hypothetical protein